MVCKICESLTLRPTCLCLVYNWNLFLSESCVANSAIFCFVCNTGLFSRSCACIFSNFFVLSFYFVKVQFWHFRCYFVGAKLHLSVQKNWFFLDGATCRKGCFLKRISTSCALVL